MESVVRGELSSCQVMVMGVAPHPRRRSQARPSPDDDPPTVPRKPPITTERITAAALQVVATQGYDALTIRSVTNSLDTGPSSLYAHIATKSDLDDLLIGHLLSEIV